MIAPPPDEMSVANAALRVGMICGMLYAVDEATCTYLMGKGKDEFMYGEQVKLVLEMRKRLLKL